MKKIMFNDRLHLTDAVLNGRKTMTRRIIKAPKKMDGEEVYGIAVVTRPGSHEVIEVMATNDEGGMINNILPMYKPGEVVAVAQNYKDAGYDPQTIQEARFKTDNYGGWQIGDFEIRLLPGWKNKMFTYPSMMAHQIRITNVRVERLQDISDEDCLREGIYELPFCEFAWEDNGKTFKTAREAFAALIDKISGNGTWRSNPCVFVYEFELWEDEQ